MSRLGCSGKKVAAERDRDNTNITAKGIARRKKKQGQARNQGTPRSASWAKERGSLLQAAPWRINIAKIYRCCKGGIARAGTGSD